MGRIFIFWASLFINIVAFAQKQTINVTQIIWGTDYQIYLQLDNDTTFQYDFNELIIANPDEAFNRPTGIIYYPVSFDAQYIDSLLRIKDKNEFTDNAQSTIANKRKVSLWGAVRDEIGGGWVHFINCLLFALESRQLVLEAPIMMRPISNWKPDPVTETWKRTHKWKYFIPLSYREALKEYKIRKKNHQLSEIENLPENYVKLFLKTNDRKYRKLLKNKDYRTIAKIDLIKLLLGAPYLGEAQIKYIKSRILSAIQHYNAHNRPSVLIFDKYNAAVVVSLDGLGYKVHKIVFRDEDFLSPEQYLQRTNIIRGIIELINVSNNEAFKKKLAELYK